jgi:hypothetical protein
MNFLNATPHAIDLIIDGEKITIPPSGVVVRVATVRELVDTIPLGEKLVPVNVVKSGLTLDLPEFQENVVIIVSRMVAEAHPERHDLVFPDSLTRDNKGNVIGCNALGSLWRETDFVH